MFILGLMRPLEAYRLARLSLEELVSAANNLLPDVLPNDIADQRLKEELTPRLVRHYASQGSLEEPQKEGREARYTYRHLLQLLALRRLQAEGHRTGAVAPLTSAMSDSELEKLLGGQSQVALTQSSNSALDFLQSLRSGGGQPAAGPSVNPVNKETRWVHHKLAPGLKLEIREDFRVPNDLAPLLKQIEKALRSSGHRRYSR
jgi:DNA-binding transcriptional MerR regulator